MCGRASIRRRPPLSKLAMTPYEKFSLALLSTIAQGVGLQLKSSMAHLGMTVNKVKLTEDALNWQHDLSEIAGLVRQALGETEEAVSA
jgi:hypothetical protein